MLEASCSLEVSEKVLTVHRNPTKTDEVTLTGSENDASSFGVSKE